MQTSKYLLTILLSLALTSTWAQSDSTQNRIVLKGGIDLLSNFIWRGYALDPNPCFQPALIAGNQKFEVGVLGSYSLGGTFNATPFYAKYNFITKAGTFSPMLFNYYYPFKNIPFDRFKDGTGANTLEGSLAFNSNAIPFRMFVSTNVLNDPKNSTYCEVGYMIYNSVEGSVELFTGASLTKNSAWLGAEDAGITNAGVTAMRKFLIEETCTVPVSLSYVVHTQLKYAYLSAKIGVSL
jgi:hypothetical protein